MNKTRRKIVAGLIVWTFIHSYFLILGYSLRMDKALDYAVAIENQHLFPRSSIHKINYSRGATYFVGEIFPFYQWDYGGFIDNMVLYDFSEFFVYVAGAWMIFYLYQYINKKE